MLWMRVVAPSDFGTNASTPALTASFHRKGSAKVVNITSGIAGNNRFSARVASIPFITGIIHHLGREEYAQRSPFRTNAIPTLYLIRLIKLVNPQRVAHAFTVQLQTIVLSPRPKLVVVQTSGFGGLGIEAHRSTRALYFCTKSAKSFCHC